tara:strand:- start:463 stop:657 length:195 start_codon:yes stop_codon:yes gene_type:complete
VNKKELNYAYKSVYVLVDVKNYETEIKGVFTSLLEAEKNSEKVRSLNAQILEFEINQLQPGTFC